MRFDQAERERDRESGDDIREKRSQEAKHFLLKRHIHLAFTFNHHHLSPYPFPKNREKNESNIFLA